MPYASYQIKQTNAWLKVKPDYMDSFLDNCDLLVVGAKYGTGRRNHSLAQFFCAIRDDSIPDYEHPKFISFSMVGIGFKDEDIAKLNSMIKSRPKYDSKNQPKWLTHPKNSSEKPDIVIDYKENLVLEVKANSMIPSSSWGMQYALRFPRYIKIREDKGWQDIMTFSDVQRVKMEGLTGITKRKSDESKIELAAHSTQHIKKGKKKRPKSSALLESQRGLDSSQLVKKTTIFEALKIFIVSGINGYSKQALEKLAIENGAECVQKAESANILIAGNKTFHVISLINSGKYNILSYQYFLDCIKEQDLLNIEPKYMVHVTEAAREYFMEFMDPWGDSYTAFVSEEKLGEILKNMPLKNDSINRDENWHRKLANEFSERYFDYQLPGMLFLNMVSYFDCDRSDTVPDPLIMEWVKKKKTWDKLDLLSIRFQAEGGLISKTPSNQVTHVILNKHDLSNLKTLTGVFQNERLPRFVTSDWIEACIQNNTIINEGEFEPRLVRDCLY
ncbi:hypothetical protein G6F17_012210 [Rhizopus arrhizus]|nr:hypothetical protein G6F23_010756 [Rhizopus arrhizus]KAG0754584.1 hypothetical protein G6F24_012376 [Rhizopus arrhizus]KAG0780466.1 hypothetical protein G6F22_010071 [Rhizopus arrhizus]KAG0847798.1 hypothetical protein G6F17_012210 [Rhizopus arrhizus]KAG0906021.1 hypothetical protein G6F33_011703 [Rhizopus arrhizus]